MAFQKCDMQPPGADIREEIARGGPITFARFMELALYAPGCGYYERPREIGRRGDFFTSVSVGPVFGGLLAFQFARWLEEIAPPAGGHWQLVEAGAHDGRLALDVLRWLRQRRPGVLARLEYWIIEPSPERRAWQERKLSNEFRNVKWARAFGRPGSPPVRGVIFCNEMLDAMPVHRLCRDAPATVAGMAGELERAWFRLAKGASIQGSRRRPAAPSRRGGSGLAGRVCDRNFAGGPAMVVARRGQPGARQTPGAGLRFGRGGMARSRARRRHIARLRRASCCGRHPGPSRRTGPHRARQLLFPAAGG